MGIVTKKEVVNGKEVSYQVIEGVVFGRIAYRLPDSKVGTGEKVFKAEFFVDKETYKAIKKKYKKVSLEEIENEDIERRFHMPVPFPEQDEQYKVSLSVKASRTNKSGEIMDMWKEEYMGLALRPKVYNKADGDNLTSKVFFNSGAVGDLWCQEKNIDKTDETGANLKFTHLYMSKIEIDSYEEYTKKAQ